MDIVDNQACLLPREWDDRNVDYVLVFGSLLPGRYIADAETSGYTPALVNACNNLKNHGKPEDRHAAACEKIRTIRDSFKSTTADSFHEVLTELALVEFRLTHDPTPYIIPVYFDDEYEKCLPKAITNKSSIVRIKSDLVSRYDPFFKLLLELETFEQDRSLVEKLKDAFAQYVSITESGGSFYKCEVVIAQAVREWMNSESFKPTERQITVPAIQRLLNVQASVNCRFIRRLFGELLASELRDVDIIVKDGGESSSSSQQRRVTLHGLFDSADSVAGRGKMPGRIFIHGQPGVGKSTLSRRIMYEYSCNPLLRDKFDLVVRIPLQALGPVHDFEQFLFEEYFWLVPYGKEVARLILSTGGNPVTSTATDVKILLVLDGWDEIYGSADDKRQLVVELANQPRVVITSRFRVGINSGIHPADLELEVLGLSSNSLEAYLRDFTFVSETSQEAIQRYVMTNATLNRIAHVPIYLDILCYAWEELQRQRPPPGPDGSVDVSVATPTPTDLYRMIIRARWRKDIGLLGKFDEGQPVTSEAVKAVHSPKRLERVVSDEIEVLCKLSMEMLRTNRTSVGAEEVDQSIHHLEESQGRLLPLSLEKNLASLSLLRVERHQGRPKSYSFVHLTFQEYFAAQYLAQHVDQCRQYLRQYNHDRRYQAVWRFVAGLLSSEPEQFLEFMTGLLQKPPKVGRYRHSWLVASCLAESNYSFRGSYPDSLYKSMSLYKNMSGEIDSAIENFLMLVDSPSF